jgi:hypothetical protein
MKKNILLLILLSFFPQSCKQGDAYQKPWNTDLVDVPSQTEVIQDSAPEIKVDCPCKEKIVGKGFRFSSLIVKQPDYPDKDNDDILRKLLNDIWSRDIQNKILNVIFQVDSVDMNTGIMNITAGSAWKYKSNSDPCTIEETATCEGRYEILKDYSKIIPCQVNEECGFTVSEKSKMGLYFHPGYLGRPILCGPELKWPPVTGSPVPNAIPIMKLSAEGSFKEDCTRIEGWLHGCINKNDVADILCFCNDYKYECPIDKNPEGETYCQRQCGAFWMNFGFFISTVAGLDPNCDMDDNPDNGFEGYELGGDFTADVLSDAEYKILK